MIADINTPIILVSSENGATDNDLKIPVEKETQEIEHNENQLQKNRDDKAEELLENDDFQEEERDTVERKKFVPIRDDESAPRLKTIQESRTMSIDASANLEEADKTHMNTMRLMKIISNPDLTVKEIVPQRILDEIPTFVPKYVRYYYDERSELPDEPISELKFGAVVMADVSGYSTLASKLAERGHIGAELLSKTMNGYLDKAVQIVLKHSGDVIKFAGDAIVFCWRTDSEDQNVRGEYVLQACECCLDLLKNLGNYPINIPDCEITHLNVHLGVGAGEMFDVHVGGHPGRWEHFIAGESINQLAIVLDLAKPGQLAVSHFALKYLSRIVDIASLQLGSYDKRCIILNALENKVRIKPPLKLPVLPELSDNQLEKCKLYQNYISSSGVYRILAGEKLLLNEFRKITTIFVKIKTITFKTDNCLENAQAAMDALQRALVRFEGTVRQFIVDDKGAVVLSYFGLPPFAHTNDPLVAVRAALEIRNRMRVIFGHGFAIGVATGMVYVGLIGNSSRADYTVTGDSVNMAARLMCKEPAIGNVVVDEETYMAASPFLEFEDLGKAKVKGKVNPISMYRPLHSKTANVVAMPSNIVNNNPFAKIELPREVEKLEISKLFPLLLDGKEGRIMFVESEGNSETLIRHIQGEAEKSKMSVYYSLALETERATPFYGIRSLIESISGNSASGTTGRKNSVGETTKRRTSILSSHAHDDDGALAKQKLFSSRASIFDFQKKMVGGLQTLGLSAVGTSVFNILMAQGSVDSVEDDGDDNDSMRISVLKKEQRFSDIVIDMVNRACCNENEYSPSKVILIVAMHYQWADEKSWSLLEQISKKCEFVRIVVVSFNPASFFDSRCTDIAKKLMKDQKLYVELKNLKRNEVRSVAAAMCGEEDIVVGEKLVHQLFKRTEGNRVFVENVLLHLLTAKKLVVQDGELKAADSNLDLAAEVPPNLRATITQQMDRLEQNFQLIVRYASIIGVFFDVREVLEIGKIDLHPIIVVQRINEWDRFGFISKVENEEYNFKFRSPVIRDCIYGMILYAQRVETHNLLAERYEKTLTNENAADVLPLVYEHLSKTDDDAAQRKILERLCNLFFGMKDAERGLKYYSLLLRSSRKSKTNPLDPLKIASLFREMGELYATIGDADNSMSHFLESLETLGISIQVKEKASVISQVIKKIVGICAAKPKIDRRNPIFVKEHSLVIKDLMIVLQGMNNVEVLQNIVKHAEQLLNPDPRMEVVLAYISHFTGNLDVCAKALTHVESAIDAKTVSDEARMETLEFLSLVYFAKGDAIKCLSSGIEFSELALKNGQYEKWESLMVMHSILYHANGQFTELEQACEKLKSVGEKYQEPAFERWSSLINLERQLSMNMLTDAEKSLEKVKIELNKLDPTLVSVSETLLFDAIDFDMHARLSKTTINVAVYLKTAREACHHIQSFNFMIIAPLFHYARGLFYLFSNAHDKIRFNKPAVVEFCTEINAILDTQAHLSPICYISGLFKALGILMDGDFAGAISALEKVLSGNSSPNLEFFKAECWNSLAILVKDRDPKPASEARKLKEKLGIRLE